MERCEDTPGRDEVKSGPRVVLTWGEESGRAIAAAVETGIMAVSPGCRVVQVNLAGKAGSVFGIADGVTAAAGQRLGLGRAFRTVAAERPDVAVLTGYPDFHLLLGARLRRAGVRAYWVGPPQFWAWGSFRLGLLRRSADKVACLFGFELEPLRRAGIAAAYHGYPLYDSVRATRGRAETLERLGLGPEAHYVALMPGSREAEQRFHVPLYCRAFACLRSAVPGLHGVMVCRERWPLPDGMLSVAEDRYSILRHADVALIVSGTATAEAALLGVPHVATYHLDPATRLMARLAVRLRYFALPNIIAGCRVMPEFLEPDEETLVQACLAILRDPSERERIRAGLERVRRALEPAGAAAAIARDVLQTARRPA